MDNSEKDNLINDQKPVESPIDLGKHAFEVGAEAVKDAVDATVTTEVEGAKLVSDATIQTVKKSKDFWQGLGPGLITGAADDDCSGIQTYSQTGAKYGFGLLWIAPLTFPLMAVVQEMCARIGMVTGRGLASNIRRHFPKWVLFTSTILLFSANTFNVGADLGAMAKATQLLFPSVTFWALVVGFTLLSLALQIFVPYAKYAKYLKYMALVLLVYIITAFTIKDFDWIGALKATVTPHMDFSKEQIILICGILGTTISPYLFFWQTSQEVEEQIMEGDTTIASRQGTDKKAIKKMRTDVWTGMFLSNLVMYFIIAVCAGTLFKAGIFDIESAAQAAAALRPLAGDQAYLLFTIGIIGVGLLGVPVLAGSASYAISESFGWREGLYRKFREALLFYGVIIFSMVVGLAINFIGLDPIKVLIWSAVFNGLVAPVVLVLICLLSNNKKLMGDWVSDPVTKVIGWLATGLMVVAGIATLYSIFS